MSYNNLPDYRSQDKTTEMTKHNCPVCNSYLGQKLADEEKSLHCKECRAWFTWFPGITKPISKLDRDVPDQCNCPGCKARRGDLG